jgi:ribose transport system ATP-binding protein
MNRDLRLRHWSIQFGGNRALDDVSVTFPAGTVTALLGGNGSGKSTLVKILAGVYTPAPGSTLCLGQAEVPLPLSPTRARTLGIGFLHQDPGLIQDASVAENIAFADAFGTRSLGWISKRKITAEAARALERIGCDIDPGALVSTLSMRDRTLVALARLLASRRKSEAATRVLVVDEPTASLDPADAVAVYKVTSAAARAGAAVILITHHLEEVIDHASRVVVLRGGRLVAEADVSDLGVADLARLMLGDAQWRAPQCAEPITGPVLASPALSVRGVTSAHLRDVSFDLKSGEILGIAGLRADGPGQLADVLSGTIKPQSGTVLLPASSDERRRRRQAGGRLAVVPEDRQKRGVHPAFSIKDNLALSSFVSAKVSRLGPLRGRRDRKHACAWIERLGVRPESPDVIVGKLSGGNQQKVALARALALQPRVLILDEPTQGVDIGARAVISREIRDFVVNGGAVVLFSSNHEEILELCDRILVFQRGRIGDEIPRHEISRSRLVSSIGSSATARLLAPTQFA